MKINRLLLLTVFSLTLHACTTPQPAPTLPVVTLPPPTLLGTQPIASPSPATPLAPANQAEAIATIRAFMGQPDLALTFVDSTRMINSPNGDLQVWQYSDDTGRTYLVEFTTSRLLEIDPPSGMTHSSTAPLYSAAELQTRADDLMAAAMPEFADLKPNLDFQASNKSDSIFFFRWDDGQATGWKMNRPFAQIALTGDGTLVSYYNTLVLK